MRTLKSLDQAGLDLRLWCYGCQRAAVIDSIIWQHFEERGWPLEVAAARARFRCGRCRATGADVLIVATRRPRRDLSNAAVDLVAGFFHSMRSAATQRKYKAQGKR